MVQQVPATAELLGKTVIANGTLAADEQAAVGFKVPGRIVSISVDLGSSVRRGDPIARLDPTDYELRVQQAQAALQQIRVRLGLDPTGATARVDPEQTGVVRQARALLDEARANRERGLKLAASGVIARAELDAYESAYRVAEARYQDALEEVRNRQAQLLERQSELGLARQQLADTVLRASMDGAVSERTAAVGEFVAAGAAVVTLVRLHPLRMRAEIPEREAAGVANGQGVRVVVEGQAVEARGRVARVSPMLNEQSRVLVVEIEVNNERGELRPGGFARAEIGTAVGESAMLVPARAVVTFAGIEKVFLVREGKAVERVVTTGRREGDAIEITSGLESTDMVVADPGNLTAGQPVAVQQ